MNLLSILAATKAADTTSGIAMMILYVVFIGGFFYFVLIKPQKIQQKETATMLSALENGDSVLTTSGFYGIVIDINEDVVIVEFGNNKNCRIPMQKGAIAQVEKASDGVE